MSDNGSWVSPNLSCDGSDRNSSLLTEQNIYLAAETVLLIGNPDLTNSMSCKSLNVVVKVDILRHQRHSKSPTFCHRTYSGEP